MIERISKFLLEWGVAAESVPTVARLVGMVVVLLAAAISYGIGRLVVLKGARFLAGKTKVLWDDKLLRRKTLFWVIHAVPAMVVYRMAPMVLEGLEGWQTAVETGLTVYLLVVAMLALWAFVDAVGDVYRGFSVAKEVPIAGVLQLLKILLAFVTVILVVAELLDKPPGALLTGLGALTAVLMLVFKDAILGLAGGLQLSMNRMVARGDWIEMPKFGADGTVEEILLTTVKVRNWDKTITTIPTYALISDSFKNWRGMEKESEGRRIKRALFIDMWTVRLCTPEMVEGFRKIKFVQDYLAEKEAELAAWNEQHGIDDSVLVNGRRLTNVGTFRAYILSYLRNHPKVHQGMTLLVRQLAPTAHGLPIEIYCFSADKAWVAYEDVQADVFDHLIAVAPEFGLSVYQEPAGRDALGVAGG
ncbi:MAG: mechanosensitive ion channel family protein [Verrucomicrobiales bacterium]|nr:mechanosensitive ion channel family protein [Verrucomicrobiales bacterium]